MGKKIVVSTVTLFVCLMTTSAMASISPEYLEAVLAPGESIPKIETVALTGEKPKVDIIFALDLTGSMGQELLTMKDQITAIMDNLDELIEDARYGVMSFMDYANFGMENNCGYDKAYGVNDDYPYNLDQSLTADRAKVQDVIEGLTLGTGIDLIVDYTRILYESYADPAVGFRPDAKKIVILFGDNLPHDCNVNECLGIEPPLSLGKDPGRDEVLYDPTKPQCDPDNPDPGCVDDDLVLMDVLQKMKEEKITLLAVWSEADVDEDYSNYWECWTAVTGGAVYSLSSDPGQIPDAIYSLVESEVTHLDELCLEDCDGWLTSIVPQTSVEFPVHPDKPECFGEIDIIGTVDLKFDVEFTAPEDICDGKTNDYVHECEVRAMSGSVEYGKQPVKITVPCTEHPGLEICGNGKVKYIQLHESNDRDVPLASCDLKLNFTTKNGQIYEFPVTASGTQICHALLKAFNYCERVDLCLRYNLYPFEAEVTSIGVGAYPRVDAGCDGIIDD